MMMEMAEAGRWRKPEDAWIFDDDGDGGSRKMPGFSMMMEMAEAGRWRKPEDGGSWKIAEAGR